MFAFWISFGAQVPGVLGWLAGKVVYRYASFLFVKKNFLDFYLKPKSLTLKEKNSEKCFLSWKLKSFLLSSPRRPHAPGVASGPRRLRPPALRNQFSVSLFNQEGDKTPFSLSTSK